MVELKFPVKIIESNGDFFIANADDSLIPRKKEVFEFIAESINSCLQKNKKQKPTLEDLRKQRDIIFEKDRFAKEIFDASYADTDNCMNEVIGEVEAKFMIKKHHKNIKKIKERKD